MDLVRLSPKCQELETAGMTRIMMLLQTVSPEKLRIQICFLTMRTTDGVPGRSDGFFRTVTPMPYLLRSR